jgi:hypothetical protein
MSPFVPSRTLSDQETLTRIVPNKTITSGKPEVPFAVLKNGSQIVIGALIKTEKPTERKVSEIMMDPMDQLRPDGQSEHRRRAG